MLQQGTPLGRILHIGGALLSVFYPVFILCVLFCCRPHLREICLVALPFLVALLCFRARRQGKKSAWVLPAGVLLLLLGVVMTDSPHFFKLYPILVTSLWLGHFLESLYNPPTAVERMARLAHPDLPAEGVAYCRRVTWVWVGFFCFNNVISAATGLWGSWEIWALYNGGISYVLMGCLMGGEWVVRRLLFRA